MKRIMITWYAFAGSVLLFGVASNIILNLGYELVSSEPKIIAEIRFQSAIALGLGIGAVLVWPLFLFNLLRRGQDSPTPG